jgi:hypothetical protein
VTTGEDEHEVGYGSPSDGETLAMRTFVERKRIHVASWAFG